jgi:predicted deacetylase
MAARYVLRIDDVAPNMRWDRFLQLQRLLDAFRICPLVGVIPDNRDPQLSRLPAAPWPFWRFIRHLRDQGYCIAQHGYQHVYHTRAPSVLTAKTDSEFAGTPYSDQLARILKGAEILQSHGLATDIFMAPSHAYDAHTLRALREAGFRYVTDGLALFPFVQHGLTFVPQLVASPRWLPTGIHTFCLHPNTMSERDFVRVERFLERYHLQVIPFPEAARSTRAAGLQQTAGWILGRTLSGYRRTRIRAERLTDHFAFKVPLDALGRNLPTR